MPQGQLTVANGVLFGATSALHSTTDAALFALDTVDGTILTEAGLDIRTVQNGPSIVDDVLYQGTGGWPSCICMCDSACSSIASALLCLALAAPAREAAATLSAAIQHVH